MQMKLKLILLGEGSIQKRKTSIKKLPSRAAEALFFYLACNQRPFSRETLAELLWADRSITQGLTNLRTILTALRRELEEFLIITRDTLAFNVDSNYWLDVQEFEQNMRELGLPDHGKTPKDDAVAAKLSSALKLYRGDFLEGFHLRNGRGFEEWQILYRERLKQFARNGFRLLTSYYLENGSYTEGIISASRWQKLDPYDEETCRTQMWLFVRTGQKNAALQCYKSLEELLEKDLGVEPASATKNLYQWIKQLDFPPQLQLPVYSTNFLGRTQEIADIEKLLISKESRLITLVGPGGMGKTRLAVETTRALAEHKPGRFLNGTAFISLMTLKRPQDIPTRIAEVLGIRLQGQDTPQKQIIDYLSDKEYLLILDNIEHLLNEPFAVDLLVDILRNAPEVKLLLTTRERLNLYDEIVYDVHGLDVPNNDVSITGDSSAITLFVHGAQRLRHAFLPSANENLLISNICQAVGGMPLAIEMASAWIRDYSLGQIAAQIMNNSDFLKSPYRDVPTEHKSLRIVFERSWSLLTPNEQNVYAQLTVFQGGFTVDASRSIINAKDDSENFDTVITALADKSLLERQTEDRFDIHPLLAQFAAEKLSASYSDLENLADHHASFYLKFLSQLKEGESPESRAKIRTERDNIHVAWIQAATTGKRDDLEQAASIMQSFFSMESWFQEGIDLFQEVLDLLIERKSPDTEGLLCDLLGRKARMHSQIGQLEEARAESQRALSYLEHMDNPSLRSRALDSLAITSYYSGNYQQATDLAEQSLQLSQQAKNMDGVAFSLNFLGSCAKAQGNYDQCQDYFERAAEACRANSDEIGVAMVLNNLGNLLQIREDYEGARQYYLQSSEVFKAKDHTHGAATTLANAGKLALKQKDYQLANRLLEESLVLKRKIGDKRGEAVALAGLGDVAMYMNDLNATKLNYKLALEMAQQIDDVQLVLEILSAIALWASVQENKILCQRLAHFVSNHGGTSEEVRQQVLPLLNSFINRCEGQDIRQSDLIEDVVCFALSKL